MTNLIRTVISFGSISLLVLSSYHKTIAQNMVPNPSFETSNACPGGTAVGMLPTHCPPWIRVPGGTPDYHHPCSTNPSTGAPNNFFGYQQARTGNAYVGIWVSNTSSPPSLEYVQAPLSSPMVAGGQYYAKMYVNLANACRTAADRIGMYFSNNSLQQIAGYPNAQPWTPQVVNGASNFITDTLNWTKIQGYYTAVGGESWLSIGNFTGIPYTTFVSNPGATWTNAYYYIDDICVINLNGAPDNTSQKDTIICTYPGDLHAPTAGDAYLWSTGDTTQTIQISTPGTYWVKTIHDCSFDLDSIIVNFGASSMTKKTTDTFLCNDAQLELRIPANAQDIEWSTGASANNELISAPGTYWVTYGDNVPCRRYVDTFKVTWAPDQSFTINDTAICNQTSFQIRLPGGYKDYTWQDGSKDSILNVSVDGTYTFTLLSKYNCVYTDNTNVTFINTRQFLKDTVLCNNVPVSVLLKANLSPTATATWNDGSTAPDLLVKDYGTYTLTVSDRGCTFTQSVNVSMEWCDCTFLIPNAFSPNNDGVNDYYGAVLPSDCQVRGYVMYIYNRWGQTVFVSYHPDKKWDGTYNGKSADAGTYFYNVQLEAGAKTSIKYQKGELNLIR